MANGPQPPPRPWPALRNLWQDCIRHRPHAAHHWPPRAAQTDLAHVDPETDRVLHAYARGINTFITINRNRLPLEFTILDFSRRRGRHLIAS